MGVRLDFLEGNDDIYRLPGSLTQWVGVCEMRFGCCSEFPSAVFSQGNVRFIELT